MKPKEEIQARIKDLETKRNFLIDFIRKMIGETVTVDQVNREVKIYDTEIDALKWAINEELPF